MPWLEYFMEYLTQEKDKLFIIGTIKPWKDQYLVFGDSKLDSKGNNKPKKPPSPKGDNAKSHDDPTNSKKKDSHKKKGKGEMRKCA